VKKSIFQLMVATTSMLLPAAAFALSVAGGLPSGSVAPNLFEDFYHGPHLVVEVRGWIYPVGMKPPADAPVIWGKIGPTEYAMLLTPDLSAKHEISPFGIGENENLRSDTAFQRTIRHKRVRIVTDSQQDKQLDADLRSADKPIALDAWVSDSPSPLLTILLIDPPDVDDATSPAMIGASPTRSWPVLGQTN
jgi:hypothetical protein